MRSVTAAALAILTPHAVAAEILLPAGTAVYGELDEQVTSKKKQTAVGDIVRAHTWRNVVVDGRVVVDAGSPIITRVAMVRPAKMAGRKGEVHLEAVSVRAVDGSEIFLDGGYDKSGKGRRAAAWTMFALVAWPLIFLKGKQAVLDPGTVFDATVQADARIAVDSESSFVVKLGDSKAELGVEVLYDEMDPDAKQKLLPLLLRACGGSEIKSPAVVTVNERDVPQIPISVSADSRSSEGCVERRGTLDLKSLAKHFSKGINRFLVRDGGLSAEVVLEVEL